MLKKLREAQSALDSTAMQATKTVLRLQGIMYKPHQQPTISVTLRFLKGSLTPPPLSPTNALTWCELVLPNGPARQARRCLQHEFVWAARSCACIPVCWCIHGSGHHLTTGGNLEGYVLTLSVNRAQHVYGGRG